MSSLLIRTMCFWILGLGERSARQCFYAEQQESTNYLGSRSAPDRLRVLVLHDLDEDVNFNNYEAIGDWPGLQPSRSRSREVLIIGVVAILYSS
jgi:hypothetical protein